MAELAVDMLPLMLWAGVGSEVFIRGETAFFEDISVELGVLEGLCGVCGRSEGISVISLNIKVIEVVVEKKKGEYGGRRIDCCDFGRTEKFILIEKIV